MSDSYDDYETKMQLVEHEWEMVKTEHDRAVELGKAYERGWNAALAQREWVPEALRLADALDELDRQFSRNGLCGDAAAELRRLHEALETEQQPVAWTPQVWRQFRPDGTLEFQKIRRTPNGEWEDYTAPQPRQWQGLTDEEINSVRHKRDWTAPWTDTTFARAIEAKLKERNG